MYIHGYYYNRLEEKISVYILIRGDRSEKVEIGGDGSGIFLDTIPHGMDLLRGDVSDCAAK